MFKSSTLIKDKSQVADLRSVDKADVAASLVSGVRWLYFPKPLERLFENETGARRSWHLLVGMIPALLLFELLVLVDYEALPDIFWPATILRLGVMSAVGLAAMWVLSRNPRPMLREGVAMLVVVTQSAILLVLVALSESEFRGHYHVGMLLGLMFGVMVLRMRFWFMLAAAVMTLALFLATSVFFSGLPRIEQQGMGSMMFAATIFSLIAGYSLEREQRLTWLRSLSERLRSDQFEILSTVDPLTGLGNRRALDQALDKLCRDGRCDQSFALAIADIDHFKAYNDAFGHVAGDDCLRRVAGLLTSEARLHGDAVFRFGGEEFVILLPAVEMGTALRVCDRIRRVVEAAGIPHVVPRRNGRLTLSFGVAVAVAGEVADLNGLIFQADTALYNAKDQGRNRVVPPPLRYVVPQQRAG